MLSLNGHEVFTSRWNCLGNEAYSWLDDLLRTDIAMSCQGRGKSRYEVFDSAMNDQAFTRLQLETDYGRQSFARSFELTTSRCVENRYSYRIRGTAALGILCVALFLQRSSSQLRKKPD